MSETEKYCEKLRIKLKELEELIIEGKQFNLDITISKNTHFIERISNYLLDNEVFKLDIFISQNKKY